MSFLRAVNSAELDHHPLGCTNGSSSGEASTVALGSSSGTLFSAVSSASVSSTLSAESSVSAASSCGCSSGCCASSVNASSGSKSGLGRAALRQVGQAVDQLNMLFIHGDQIGAEFTDRAAR